MLDTGTMLQLKRAHTAFLRDLREIGRELYRLAEQHKNTPMAGRTHAVQALPITFGHKAAIWLAETGRNYERLKQTGTDAPSSAAWSARSAPRRRSASARSSSTRR